MQKETNKYEQLLNEEHVKNDFINKIESYLTKSEKETLQQKINEIIQSKSEHEGMDHVFEKVYDFLENNMPENVNIKLYQDIVAFINANLGS